MKKFLDIEDIIPTPFYLELHQSQINISKNLPSRPGYKSGCNNHHLLNDIEKRTTRIFRLTDGIFTMLKDIRLCYLFINKSLDKAFIDRYEISELDYIRYHFEVFIHKIHTINEIMKLLCNETLDLGIPPKECSWAKLISFEIFRTSKSKVIIEKNFADFKHLIEDRHLNTHRGIFDNKEIDEFSPTYFIYHFAKYNNYELEEDLLKALSPSIIRRKIKELKKAKVIELKKYEQKVLENTHSFFKSLILNPNDS